MVKYTSKTCGKKYGIKQLKSLVDIKENAVYKGSNLFQDRERQRTGERQRDLLQTIQMADSPIKGLFTWKKGNPPRRVIRQPSFTCARVIPKAMSASKAAET